MSYVELKESLNDFTVEYYIRPNGEMVAVVGKADDFGNATTPAHWSRLETTVSKDAGRLFSIPDPPPKEPA